jgi:hypothetical protein
MPPAEEAENRWWGGPWKMKTKGDYFRRERPARPAAKERWAVFEGKRRELGAGGKDGNGKGERQRETSCDSMKQEMERRSSGCIKTGFE